MEEKYAFPNKRPVLTDFLLYGIQSINVHEKKQSSQMTEQT